MEDPRADWFIAIDRQVGWLEERGPFAICGRLAGEAMREENSKPLMEKFKA